MINSLLKSLLKTLNVEDKHIDTAKMLLEKIEKKTIDGKETMIVHIGKGIELRIEQEPK